MGDQASGSTDPEKPWERPWTLEEMRQSAGNWSLAGDAGMLLYLQGFSQRMISKTHSAQAQVNDLLNDVKLTDVRIQNSFNDFIMLANTQFVENRVYDEDVTQEPVTQAEPKEEKEKTKEDREAELVPKISHALGLGLQVIDTAFEKLDISEANSDSEDEDSPSNKGEPLLEPKDPYITRPLPYLIGSQAFFQDDHVGLVDISSDEEEESQGTISESESEKSEESEAESEEGRKEPPLPRQPIMHSSGSESEESGDLFGEEKSEKDASSESEKEDEREEIPKNRGPASFTDELASKLGGGKRSTPVKVDENENQQPEKVHKEKKRNKSKNKIIEEPDMFSTEPPDDDDDDDDSPFSKQGGLFSTSKGLFDDDEDGGGLFDDDVKKPETNKVPEPKPAKPDRLPSTDQTDYRLHTKSGKKLPIGAVSIFGDDDVLFGSKEKEATPPPKVTLPAVSRPPAKPSSGLFEESDEDDLFAPPPMNAPPKSNASQTKKTIDLFMDEDEDDGDDLFPSQPTIKVTQPKKSQESEPKASPPAQKKKLPAGAVSIFGAGANPLAAAIKAQRPASPEEEESSDEKSFTSTTSSSIGPRPPPLEKEPSPAPSSNSLFAEEPEDDLFSKPSVPKNKTKSTLSKGLFEDEDEGLFTPTPSNKPKPAAVTKPRSASKDLFEDEAESDDLFGNLSVPPAQPAKKKPVGGVSIFGDNDPFGKSAKPTAVPKEQEKAPEPVKQKAKRLSLFDEDEQEENLFGATNKSEESVKVTKESKDTKKPQASKGLFDGDDDLFGGPSQEVPSVDLFGPSSPIKQKPNPLANERDSAPSLPPEKESSEPPKSALLLKGATITASSTDLFGEIEDDGDLFVAPTATKKVDPPLPVPGATTTESSSDTSLSAKSQEVSSGGQSRSKKPVGGVSLFGGLDLSSALKKGTEKSEKSEKSPEKQNEEKKDKNELFKGSPKDEADLFSKPKSTSRNLPSSKPVDRPSPSSFKNTAVSSKPSNVGKLKMNLAIDPTALLPGASRPTEEKKDTGVGFEAPAVADTLFSAQKSRAKIQGKRRPPTRRHLQKNATENNNDNILVAGQDSTDNHLTNDVDHLTNSVSSPGLRNTSDKAAKSPESSPINVNGASGDSSSTTDDLFSSPPKASKTTNQTSKTHNTDDIFGDIPQTKPKEAAKPQKPVEDSFDDIFSDSSLLKKSQKKASIFDDVVFASIPKKSAEKEIPNLKDDDIFSSDSLKPKKSKKTTAPLLDDSDDIFKTLPAKSNPSKPKPPVDDDDIFASATSKSQSSRRPKKAVTNDDDIFSDHTDIFADITASKKDKKPLKSGSSAATGDSLFRDADMEDIFASAKSSKKSSQSAKKRLDAGETSIFDDPLNSLND